MSAQDPFAGGGGQDEEESAEEQPQKEAEKQKQRKEQQRKPPRAPPKQPDEPPEKKPPREPPSKGEAPVEKMDEAAEDIDPTVTEQTGVEATKIPQGTVVFSDARSERSAREKAAARFPGLEPEDLVVVREGGEFRVSVRPEARDRALREQAAAEFDPLDPDDFVVQDGQAAVARDAEVGGEAVVTEAGEISEPALRAIGATQLAERVEADLGVDPDISEADVVVEDGQVTLAEDFELPEKVQRHLIAERVSASLPGVDFDAGDVEFQFDEADPTQPFRAGGEGTFGPADPEAGGFGLTEEASLQLEAAVDEAVTEAIGPVSPAGDEPGGAAPGETTPTVGFTPGQAANIRSRVLQAQVEAQVEEAVDADLEPGRDFVVVQTGDGDEVRLTEAGRERVERQQGEEFGDFPITIQDIGEGVAEVPGFTHAGVGIQIAAARADASDVRVDLAGSTWRARPGGLDLADRPDGILDLVGPLPVEVVVEDGRRLEAQSQSFPDADPLVVRDADHVPLALEAAARAGSGAGAAAQLRQRDRGVLREEARVGARAPPNVAAAGREKLPPPRKRNWERAAASAYFVRIQRFERSESAASSSVPATEKAASLIVKRRFDRSVPSAPRTARS